VCYGVCVCVRLLQEDPVLFQLYKDLVAANVITAEEFWANRFTVSLYHVLILTVYTVYRQFRVFPDDTVLL